MNVRSKGIKGGGGLSLKVESDLIFDGINNVGVMNNNTPNCNLPNQHHIIDNNDVYMANNNNLAINDDKLSLNYGMYPFNYQHELNGKINIDSFTMDDKIPNNSTFYDGKIPNNPTFPQFDGKYHPNVSFPSMGMLPCPQLKEELLNNMMTTMNPLQTKLSYIKEENIKSITTPFIELSGGVIYDNGPLSNGGRWLIFWSHRGRIWRKAYSISMYGYNGAKELAELFWVNKMRAIQLFNRSKQEKLLLLNDNGKMMTTVAPATMMTAATTTTTIPTSLPPHPPPSHPPLPTTNLPTSFNKMKNQQPSSSSSSTNLNQQPIDDSDVFWDENTKSWCFEYVSPDYNNLYTRKFKVVNDDINDAKNEAIKYKNIYYQEFLRNYSESKYSGLTYEKARCCWRVAYWISSKKIKKNKYFNISKYGYQIAKEYSEQYRLLLEQYNGNEPPQHLLNDQLPTQEFLQLNTTQHIHKLLYSFRPKENRLKSESLNTFSNIINNIIEHDQLNN